MTDITPFANRLGKNIKHLMKWAKRNNIEAWRIYDRDIPQFPFAVDVYGDQIHLQEYDTGWLMQPKEYEAWLADVLEAIGFVTGFAPEQIHLKRRERQKGLQQYEKTGKTGDDFVITENGRKFGSTSTNTSTPASFSTTATPAKSRRNRSGKTLPQPVFLHRQLHRLCRHRRRGIQRNRRLVQHLSRLGETQFRTQRHQPRTTQNRPRRRVPISANAAAEGKQFDLIVMDPPSFSNSKKMLDILDIQREP